MPIPYLNEQNAFSAATGFLTVASNGVYAVSLFNPAKNTKTFTVFMVRIIDMDGTAEDPHQIRANTSGIDPAYPTPVTAVNMSIGSTIASTASVTASTAVATPTGGILGMVTTTSQIGVNNDLIVGDQYIIPPGMGITAYITVNSAFPYGCIFRYYER